MAAANNLFSVPIFFLVFRESLEAAIIISVLLGLVKQIADLDVHATSDPPDVSDTVAVQVAGQEEKDDGNDNGNGNDNSPRVPSELDSGDSTPVVSESGGDEQEAVERQRLLKKMRIQIFLGSGIGLLIALGIGAAFITLWFTKAADLWQKSESLWEGIFSLVASIIIFVIAITMLKIDRAKVKWRVKLQRAFSGKDAGKGANTGRWMLFVLPFVTVLREGLEAVVFVGGVSLGQPASAIPIAAVVGIICGLIVGFVIYAFATRSAMIVFMVVMTNLLLLVGAGLFSKAIGAIQNYGFGRILKSPVDDLKGNGPGTYDVRGNVWHLNCCNPAHTLDGNGWLIFAAIFGWTNSASLGTVLGYVFYWIAVIAAIVVAKWKEGRVKIWRFDSSAAAASRRSQEEALASVQLEQQG